jgi:lipoate-protein ligase A
MTGQDIQFLDLTLPSPAQNLACDEALLDACDAGTSPQSLRFWESTHYFAVVGFSNQADREINVEACRREGVPIYRRCSGGGAVLQGPGCLNYTLVLRIDETGPLASIASTNRHIMERHAQALSRALNVSARVRGITDLAVGELKFSGNAQRRKRHALLFHGTFLLNFDLARLERLLQFPSQQPDYRQNRPHGAFVKNLGVSRHVIQSALRHEWNADSEMGDVPDCDALVREKYETDAWNLRM